MKSFVVKSVFLTVIVLMVGAVVYSTVFKQFFLIILPVTVGFFFIVTNLVHSYLLKIAASSGSRFASRYMAASFLKMFFYMVVAVAYAILNRADAKIFLANFLLLYIVYTTFEVIEISKTVRQINK